MFIKKLFLNKKLENQKIAILGKGSSFLEAIKVKDDYDHYCLTNFNYEIIKKVIKLDKHFFKNKNLILVFNSNESFLPLSLFLDSKSIIIFVRKYNKRRTYKLSLYFWLFDNYKNYIDDEIDTENTGIFSIWLCANFFNHCHIFGYDFYRGDYFFGNLASHIGQKDAFDMKLKKNRYLRQFEAVLGLHKDKSFELNCYEKLNFSKNNLNLKYKYHFLNN